MTQRQSLYLERVCQDEELCDIDGPETSVPHVSKLLYWLNIIFL